MLCRANKQREGKIQAVTVLTGEASLNNMISASQGPCKPTLNWPLKLRNFEQTSEGESRCSFTRLWLKAQMLNAAGGAATQDGAVTEIWPPTKDGNN